MWKYVIKIILILSFVGLSGCVAVPPKPPVVIGVGGVVPVKTGATYLLMPVIGTSRSTFEFCGRPDQEFTVLGYAVNLAEIWCDTPTFSVSFGEAGISRLDGKSREASIILKSDDGGRFEYRMFEVFPGPQYLAKSFGWGGNGLRHSVYSGRTLAFDLEPGKINYVSHLLLGGALMKPTAVDAEKARSILRLVGGESADALFVSAPLMTMAAACKKTIDPMILLTGYRRVQCVYGVPEPVDSEAPELESDLFYHLRYWPA